MGISSKQQVRQTILLLIGISVYLLLTNIVFAHGMSEEEKRSIIEGGNMAYLWLGATHMLSGYDHLAFVFGIIFFLTSFRDIVKYITAFTIGHSITLIFATFNAIQMNYFLIDAVIGLSVSYIAFTNLDGFQKYLNIRPPNMMAMIVSLGLIHGFGLSTRLQLLPLSEDQLLMNIISFNIGVELGQISALFLMLLLLTAWRKSHFFKTFSLIANYALIFWGVYLFLLQMHGYEHNTNQELAGDVTGTTVQIQNISQNTEQLQDLRQLPWRDTITVELPARGDTEYKLFVKSGSTFAYSWQTNGETLFYDFHAEPSSGTTGSFQSFAKDTDKLASGSLTALFDGTHGWYWKNNNRLPVIITLKLKGNYELVKDKKNEEQLSTDEKLQPYVHETL